MKKRKILTESEEKRKTKRMFLWMIISGLVCAMLGVGVLMYFFAPRDNDTFIVTVPTFVGRNDSDIELSDGFEIEREWIYSNEVDKGVVISQEPYGGARRKIKNGQTCRVAIYISLGEKTEKLPELSGIDEVSAANALRSIGVDVRSVAIYTDGEDGCVISTRPSAGTELKVGDKVTIFVSRKREECPITVPNFCGLELGEAVSRALSLGLCVTDVDAELSDATVSAQSIPEGARVRRGSYIRFRVGYSEFDEEKEREWPPDAQEQT